MNAKGMRRRVTRPMTSRLRTSDPSGVDCVRCMNGQLYPETVTAISTINPMKGVIAAIATPIDADGRLNVKEFERLIDMLIDSGVDGVCLGGATSEYPNVAVTDRRAAIDTAAPRVGRDTTLLIAIGAPSFHQVIELGEAAADAGCGAVLLPMPMFFRYQQHDLEAFSVEVARRLRSPV